MEVPRKGETEQAENKKVAEGVQQSFRKGPESQHVFWVRDNYRPKSTLNFNLATRLIPYDRRDRSILF